MQSNNPVFRRSAEFNGSSAQQYPTYPGYPQGGQATVGAPYGNPSQWDVAQGGSQGGFGGPTGYAEPAARMTIDSVVQKTAFSVGTVVLVAMATWVLTPDLSDANPGGLFTAVLVGSLGAFALSMVNSFKRVISPALVMAFAVLEGVALGALSKIFEGQFGGGIVAPAVFGTFAAFAGTLAAYKVFDITVTDKFRRGVMAAVFGMVALSLMELVLGFFGNSFGLFGFGGLGLVFSLAGLALGIFMLILDFDFVEQGVRHGLPERESWRAAFAMTVSLVWIYTNLLRIMAIFSQD
ncbi:Bax inhibitor-1/YccA family protein [Nocardioides perillae]|uniref:Putative YccA/Bax inhibitor family protein n=1 Tax=Nocardioides perillae TaxID=1119534 RepID=A0A7Y9RY20_9ACTN|nr:Bax inhibitor-1/YccA family protein [Nocardioides perillae]NYG56838.1 putative YccA/Bax inhibitor family protein [Nocardioides perillae]